MAAMLLVGRFTLAAVLSIAGAAKLADLPASRRAIAEYGLPRRLAAVVGTLLPGAELGLTLALWLRGSATWAATGAAVLFGLFLTAIVSALIRGERPDCGCFGPLHSERIGSRTAIRAALLMIVAALVAIAGWADPRRDPFPGRYGFAALPLILAVITAAIGPTVLLYLRARLTAAAQAALNEEGADSLIAGRGSPRLGQAAANFALPTADGQTVTLGALLERGRPLLLIFADPACAACRDLWRALHDWRERHAARLTFAVISPGQPTAIRDRLAQENAIDLLYETDGDVRRLYGAHRSPSAILVGAHGRIISTLAVGHGAIGRLVEEIRRSATGHHPRRATGKQPSTAGVVELRGASPLSAEQDGPDAMGTQGRTRRHVLRSAIGLVLVMLVPEGVQAQARAFHVKAKRSDPRNTRHDPTCTGFGQHQHQTGVYDVDGDNHPTWSGVTALHLKSNPTIGRLSRKTKIRWYCPCTQPPVYFDTQVQCESQPPCTPGLGGCLVKCGGVTLTCLEGMVNPHFTGDVIIDALRWRPNRPVSPGCKAAITAFDRAVDAHEAHHAADASTILAKAKKDPPHKVMGCGSTEQEAIASLKAAAKKYQAQRLQHFLGEYSTSIDKFHSSIEGSPINMNCGAC
jgi:peroxiredoxin